MIITDDGTPFTGTITVNGYHVGDRLLEDVWFYAKVNNGIPDLTTVRVAPYDAVYFSDLNQKKWLQEIREYITDEDEHFETIGGDDVWIDSDEQDAIEPVEIKMESMDDIMKKSKDDNS